MTTFLALANKVLVRINEVEIDSSEFGATRGPQSVAKDAVNASIERITSAAPNWPFMATDGTQLTTVGTQSYSFPTNLRTPNWQSFTVRKDTTLSIQTTPLTYIQRNQWIKFFKQNDDNGGSAGVSIPRYVFQSNSFGFSVSPSPAEIYTIDFEYYTLNTTLVLYSDISVIPANYDELIIQGALYHIYMFRENSEQAQIADQRFNRLLQEMRTNLINDKQEYMATTMIARSSPYRRTINQDGSFG